MSTGEVRDLCLIRSTLGDEFYLLNNVKHAQAKIERSNKTRVELLVEAQNGACVENCNGEWLNCVKEILDNNNIPKNYFAESVKDLL